MGRKNQPINADVPATPSVETESKPAKRPSAPKKPPQPTPAKPTKPAKRRRRPIPAALKGIVGLVVVAVVFIVAAILGGRGGEEEAPSSPAPPPVTAGSEGDDITTQTAMQLGYPTFATNNTTRVGGPDPTAGAAAVALAVYPSTTDSQRPDAVTLVDGEDWQTAIAAAVLMAEPTRAPLLISAADDLPEPTSTALDALDPQGSKAGGVQAFAIGAAAVPGQLETTRVEGDGAAGAAAIARLRERLSGAPPRHIVLAPSAQSAFAMPAAGWAARSGDPVLFAGKEKLPTPTAAVLKRHSDVPVYVLGPTSAISSSVVREIVKIGNRVRRVSGEDPPANAIALARYDDGDFGWNINDPGHGFVVARSDSPLDAAAAAALSASGTWGPLLLTDSADTLPAVLRDYMLDVKPGYTTDPTRAFYNHVWVIGDEEAIGVNQQAEIDELAELAKAGGEP
jgi:hypothetical protein